MNHPLNFNSSNIYNKNSPNSNSSKIKEFKFLKYTPEKRNKCTKIIYTNKPINFKFNGRNNSKTYRKENNIDNSEISRICINKDIKSFQDSTFSNLKGKVNRITETTKIDKISIMNDISKNKIDDNISIISKISKISRYSKIYNPLKGIEVNNNEHLTRIITKQDQLKKNNIKILNNFNDNISLIRNNILRNIHINFKNRISDIWSSYIKEQKKIKEPNSLINEIKPIQTTFNSLLKSSINLVCELFKKKQLWEIINLNDLFLSRKLKVSSKIDNYLYNEYKELMQFNINLEHNYAKIKKFIIKELKEKEKKYYKLMKLHIENFIRELNFKIFTDNKIIDDTLFKGKYYLLSKINIMDKIISESQNNGIIDRIKKLENKLNFLKSNN